MAEGHEPKIPGAAVAIGFLFLGAADMIELLVTLFALDDYWISDIITFPITQLYLRYKKARGTYSLVMQGAELIPVIGAMPLKSIGWGLVVWVDRHPEGTLAKSFELIPKVKPGTPPKAVPASARR